MLMVRLFLSHFALRGNELSPEFDAEDTTLPVPGAALGKVQHRKFHMVTAAAILRIWLPGFRVPFRVLGGTSSCAPGPVGLPTGADSSSLVLDS